MAPRGACCGGPMPGSVKTRYLASMFPRTPSIASQMARSTASIANLSISGSPMLRVLAAAAAVLTLTAAARPTPVEYRVGVAAAALDVEVRFRGDADGETRLVLPAGLADLRIQGA